ncbi:helix-turn-helix domain-containing protein [Kitasatospora aureofaciens]|uniref:helix-turn-helix domain-containing protein n=1 Tax=Kitasatospora aureofaciens TaxID=1894 RepID=UPI00210BBA33|nr:helix-turn-helix domain-containing protein [Kitasatospora aureofaciens]
MPEADRFDRWCDLVNRDLAPTRVTSRHTADFDASASLFQLGSVQLSVLAFPTLRAARTWPLIRRSDPELWQVALVAAGSMWIDQHRSQTLLGPGDLVLYDTSHPYESWALAGDGPAQVVMLHLPKIRVPIPDRAMRSMAALRMPAGSGMGAVLGTFLEQLARQAGSWHERDAVRLGAAAVDLSLAFLGHRADAERLLPPETRQTALLCEIKAFIERNLAHTELTPRTIADAHCISVRYLHRLFRQEQQTVAAFVRALRLERCRSDLAEPGLARFPVGAVGARWGFTDSTAFNRAFRAAYGLPPGEYRRRSALCPLARSAAPATD